VLLKVCSTFYVRQVKCCLISLGPNNAMTMTPFLPLFIAVVASQPAAPPPPIQSPSSEPQENPPVALALKIGMGVLGFFFVFGLVYICMCPQRGRTEGGAGAQAVEVPPPYVGGEGVKDLEAGSAGSGDAVMTPGRVYLGVDTTTNSERWKDGAKPPPAYTR